MSGRITSRIVAASLAASLAGGGAASAAEVTMRLVGSKQTFIGDLLGFDGEYYFIATPIFGKTYLDAKQFECIAGACPRTDTGYAGTLKIGPTGNSDGTVTPRQDRLSPPPTPSDDELSDDEKLRLFKEFLKWRERESE